MVVMEVHAVTWHETTGEFQGKGDRNACSTYLKGIHAREGFFGAHLKAREGEYTKVDLHSRESGEKRR